VYYHTFENIVYLNHPLVKSYYRIFIDLIATKEKELIFSTKNSKNS